MSIENEGDYRLPRTFVHELVGQLPSVDKERIRFIDLSEREVSPPPYGFSVGEDRYMVGAGKRNADAQYLITDKLLDCTGIVIEDEQSEQFLLAHLLSTAGVSRMFERFKESLSNPDKVKTVTIIPGFIHDSDVEKRIQDVIIEGMKLDPQELLIDVAKGEQGVFRGIVQDTIGGGLYSLRQPVDPGISERYSGEWARSVFK